MPRKETLWGANMVALTPVWRRVIPLVLNPADIAVKYLVE